MILFKRPNQVQTLLQSFKNKGMTVGFIPTMGALHEGHLSLIAEAKEHNDITVCSIFVNPTQFNNAGDFANYPVTIANDIFLLEQAGCDLLFLPSEEAIYPTASSKDKKFALGEVENILEGKYRPGHFQGVCMVVDRLLQIVMPDDLFMGSKDFQQCMVVKKLLHLTAHPAKLHTAATVRDADGLAKSSRNLRLTGEQRKLAPELYRWLENIRDNISPSNFNILKARALDELKKLGFKIDYLELARAKNLEISNSYAPGEEFVLLIAAYLGDIRLIDNVLIPKGQNII